MTRSEPILKFAGLGGDVEGLAKEGITCLCLSSKILALGTARGSVHVLDYEGNEIRRLALHTDRVNDLSFDKDEEHIASCSDDASVVVRGRVGHGSHDAYATPMRDLRRS